MCEAWLLVAEYNRSISAAQLSGRNRTSVISRAAVAAGKDKNVVVIGAASAAETVRSVAAARLSQDRSRDCVMSIMSGAALPAEIDRSVAPSAASAAEIDEALHHGAAVAAETVGSVCGERL